MQYAFTTIPTYPRCRTWHRDLGQLLITSIAGVACLAPDWRSCFLISVVNLSRPNTMASQHHSHCADPLVSATLPAWFCSGQIGFMICTKAGGRPPLDAREPRQPAPVAPQERNYPPLR